MVEHAPRRRRITRRARCLFSRRHRSAGRWRRESRIGLCPRSFRLNGLSSPSHTRPRAWPGRPPRGHKKVRHPRACRRRIGLLQRASARTGRPDDAEVPVQNLCRPPVARLRPRRLVGAVRGPGPVDLSSPSQTRTSGPIWARTLDRLTARRRVSIVAGGARLSLSWRTFNQGAGLTAAKANGSSPGSVTRTGFA